MLSLAYALRLLAQQAVENPAPIVQSSLSIPVSIIAPALNEERVVVAAVQSLLNQNYPEFEVILIDDGSTDGTIATLHAAFDLVPSDIRVKATFESGEVTTFYRSRSDSRLSVVRKINRGSKADAVNCGMNFAAYRYLCCVDGDTIYSGNALLDGMAIVLKNPAKVVGVTSYFGTSRHPEASAAGARRRVDSNWLSALQNIDLMRSFLVNRLAFSAIGAMMCSPGAFAIWRKDLFAEIGGFDPRFSCEDIEFTYRVHEHFRRHKLVYQIASLPRLIAMTEGPDNIRDLIKQRARWQRVLLETVWAYRRMWFNHRYGAVGLVALPYNILFEALSPLMQALSLLLLAGLAARGVLAGVSTAAILLSTALLVAMPSMLAVLIDNRQHRDYRTRDLVMMSLYSLLDLALFKPIILIAGLKGSLDFLKGKKGWDKFERNVRRSAV
ncbi:biofilm PGA synthesis N-glycosyltransferase PgaC [Lysobacter sp. HA18]